MFTTTYSSQQITKPYQKPNDALHKVNKTILLASNNQSHQDICSFCQNNSHTVYKCEKFHSLSPKDRFSFIKSKGHFVKCLSTSHTIKSCNSKHTCFTCKGKHHSLLHIKDSNTNHRPNTNDISDTSLKYQEAEEKSNDVNKCNFVGLSCNQKQTVLLATTLIKVTSP